MTRTTTLAARPIPRAIPQGHQPPIHPIMPKGATQEVIMKTIVSAGRTNKRTTTMTTIRIPESLRSVGAAIVRPTQSPLFEAEGPTAGARPVAAQTIPQGVGGEETQP